MKTGENHNTMSNVPTGCKPFNYEEAIKDLSKVVFNQGQNAGVKAIHRMVGSDDFIVIQSETGSMYLYYIDGIAWNKSQYSLFLKYETVMYGIVGTHMVICAFTTLEKAIEEGIGYMAKSISAFTISNGEVIKTETVHKY